MYRDKIHPVGSLFFYDVKYLVNRKMNQSSRIVYRLHNSLIYGDRTYGNRRRLKDLSSIKIDITTGGEVHNRVRTRLDGNPQLMKFFIQIGPIRRGADICIDLYP